MRNGMSADVSFRQVASVFHNMEFWSCLDLEELDDIFQDFLDKYLRDHHNEIRERNHENKRELFRMLENSSACERIEPGVTKWGDIVDRFRNSQVFGKLDDLDKFEVFEDFMKETLEKDRDDQRRRENRKARQARERFMSLLESRKDLIENEIKWSEFVESIRGMDEYIDLVGTRHSSQPYDLFAEMRSTWKRERCTDDVAMVVATDDNVT